MKTIRTTRVIERYWPKTDKYTCQVLVLFDPDIDVGINIGEQVAWGEGSTAEEARADAKQLLEAGLKEISK